MAAEASVALALWRNLDPLFIGSILHRPEKVRGLVLRPGFGPGSATREAAILDRTILPELRLEEGLVSDLRMFPLTLGSTE